MGLHRIARRVGQLNALRVFRDTTDLSANPNLWGRVVTDAMDRSRYLIVVLSPRAAGSEWSTGWVSPEISANGMAGMVARHRALWGSFSAGDAV